MNKADEAIARQRERDRQQLEARRKSWANHIRDAKAAEVAAKAAAELDRRAKEATIEVAELARTSQRKTAEARAAAGRKGGLANSQEAEPGQYAEAMRAMRGYLKKGFTIKQAAANAVRDEGLPIEPASLEKRYRRARQAATVCGTDKA